MFPQANQQQANYVGTARPAKKASGPIRNMASPFGRTTDGTPITQSQVSAQNPYSGSQLRAYTQPRSPSPTPYGAGSADRSRQAFAQAAAMQQSNAGMQSYEDLARSYRQAQEQTRAGDIESMRADQVRRYGMDEDYLAKRRSQENERFQRVKDIRNSVSEARRNSSANAIESFGGLLLSGLMPAAGEYMKQRVTDSARGGYSGGGFMQNMRKSLFGV